MIIAFMVLAAFLTWFVSKRKNILIAVCAFLLWFGCAMWLFFTIDPDTGSTILPLSENYAQLLSFVFLILMFIPLVLQMDTEIRHEKNGVSWVDYGDKPKESKNLQSEYRALIKSKVSKR